MDTAPTAVTVQQSTLVTVLAWLGLIWSGFSALMGLLQSVFVAFMPEMPISEAEATGMPFIFSFMFDNMAAIIVGFTLLWAFVFICSLGLLRRQEWARKAFIALLVLSALTTATMAIVQQFMLTNMLDAGTPQNPDAINMVLMMRVMSVFLALVFGGVALWLAARLNATYVREEFQRPA